MKSKLSNGLSAQDKKEMEASFNAGDIFRRKLKEVILEKAETNHKVSLNTDGYGEPCWPYKQADSVGYQRALYEIISYLE